MISRIVSRDCPTRLLRLARAMRRRPGTTRAYSTTAELVMPLDTFARRHNGPSASDVRKMLETVGIENVEELVLKTVPAHVRSRRPLRLDEPLSERELLDRLKAIASKNKIYRSYIGMGYADTIVPPVILRNVLESPGWYTQYTPYQPEISQGRLESLLNFQTMVTDLTGMAIANASLLDEGTAAAEAVLMSFTAANRKRRTFFIDNKCHPQTIACMQTRAEALGVNVIVGNALAHDFNHHQKDLAGVLVQYPATDGSVNDYQPLATKIHELGGQVVCATDLLALTILTPPGEWGADIALGNSQRLGVPFGYGGPHAAFFACQDAHKRRMPGRLVGVSKDVDGNRAYRLTLQTREQHIKREKATSNICTAQALLANMSAMYGIYHGPEGMKAIAKRVHHLTGILVEGIRRAGHTVTTQHYFDTVNIRLEGGSQSVMAKALERGINLRKVDAHTVGVTLDETVNKKDLEQLLGIFIADDAALIPDIDEMAESVRSSIPSGSVRTSPFMKHKVFNSHHSETEMLRYIYSLQSKDLSLAHSMIPLGSCTMKLNATTQMIPVTWPEFANIHPFVPEDQAEGYKILIKELESDLAEVTGFDGVSSQPNSGAQGEYTGLRVIRAYHESRGERGRDVCLIPVSAHGTNPASAAMAGMDVVPVKCKSDGDLDMKDLAEKAAKHRDRLSAFMVTYPSTFGVFEEGVAEACEIVHSHGGQVYMDGANLNAQIGICRPAEIGADVCHLNLHKTFCVAKGTPVLLASGITQPIEKLPEVGGVYVLGWTARRQGEVPSGDEGNGQLQPVKLMHKWNTGVKECVELTLQDGRVLVCTEDHLVRTTDGWIRADELKIGRSRALLGPEAPLDDPDYGERLLEMAFSCTFGRYTFTMENENAREVTLAFARLLGYVACQSPITKLDKDDTNQAVLGFTTQHDAECAANDIELLTDRRPEQTRLDGVITVGLSKELAGALTAASGVSEEHQRRDQLAIPDFLLSVLCPVAVVREYLGGLFGGNGVAPTIDSESGVLKGVSFRCFDADKAALVVTTYRLATLLRRFTIESTATEPCATRVIQTDGSGVVCWECELCVREDTNFAKRVGFRFSVAKTTRLTAATAWWRLCETADREKSDCRRVPPRITCVRVRGYSNARMSQENAAVGRATRHAHVMSTFGKTSWSDRSKPKEFLESIGARRWFEENCPSTAMTSLDEGMSVLTLQVIGWRRVGPREVYDLTVDDLHSFVANGVVVHNCIPHGGGGPGMGPIGVKSHLLPFLPGHPIVKTGGEHAIGPVAAAPYGSAGILPISWAYIKMMGNKGLTKATEIALLNANYMMRRLAPHYKILYANKNGFCAHEFIIDVRPLQKAVGISAVDIAKRLQDYGFHSPTMSWPVPNTLMVEPTESESMTELDRFCDAMIAIRDEIREIEDGRQPQDRNLLTNAPHTIATIARDAWDRAYTRERAVFPKAYLRERKFWPTVSRLDDAWGDRNLFCSCPSDDLVE